MAKRLRRGEKIEGVDGTGTTRPHDVMPLAERVVYLQALRVGLAAVILGSAAFAGSVVGARLTDVLVATAVYLVLCVNLETLRRMRNGVGRSLLGMTFIVDGVYLAWALYATGGALSPLRFLVFLHLIGVTLIVGHHTGLKVALWHSLLFFVVFYGQAADLITPAEGSQSLTPNDPGFTKVSVYNVMAFWLIALGTAAFSALNERELRKRKEEVEHLARMATEIERVTKREEVARVLLDTLKRAFHFERGVVLAGPGAHASLLASMGAGSFDDAGGDVDVSVERAWRSKSTLLLKRLDDGDQRLSLMLPMAKRLYILPLFAEGEPTGAVVLTQPSGRSATVPRRELQVLEQFVTHAALALRNADLMHEVQRLATTDALTGLANRRTFEETLERELSRAARNGEPLTLMMLDVDHFKRFNDTYGHPAGDEVLRLVGASLQASCRNFDTAARYGGEEFVVILPSCSSRESLRAADRLRSSLSELEVVDMSITASAGIATFPTHAADARSLIQAADEALYESKRAGRDRTTRSRRRGQRSEPTKSTISLPPEDVGAQGLDTIEDQDPI